MSISRINYIEFYISNLPSIQFLFNHGLGFKKTLVVDQVESVHHTSFVFQNDINIILSSSDDSLSELSRQVSLSGDFIKDVAFEVDNIEQVIHKARAWGVEIIEPIHEFCYNQEIIKKATISAFGNTNHSLIQRDPSTINSLSLQKQIVNNGYLNNIDHIAVAIEFKNLQKWVDFYKNIFGLKKIFEENVATENSGLISVVVGDEQKGIKIVLVSPMDGKSRSQINDFIINNNGEGVQHIAFSTSRIVEYIKKIKNIGIEFLDINDDYYQKLNLPINYETSFREELRNYKILYDKDEYGELLQIFSKKLHTKSTWFLEIIERRGAKTFGRGNVKKLYELMEAEMSKQHV